MRQRTKASHHKDSSRRPGMAATRWLPATFLVRFVSRILAIVAACGGARQAVAAPPWPTSYNAPAVAWTDVSLDGRFAYRSPSYLIVSKQPLRVGRVDEMAKVAESVRGVLRQLPLELLPKGGERADIGAGSRDVVRIYPTQADYTAAGGPKGSVGFFNARTGEVMVSQEFLIEPKGHRSNLEPRQRYRLLVHELVHQAMGSHSAVLPLWFTEGIAEYIAAMQFAPGRYRFDNSSRQIISHLRAVWLHDRRHTITIPEVESILRLHSASWAHDNRNNKENAYAKYAASLLLTHYQLELASRGLGGLREFLVESTALSQRSRRRSRRGPGKSRQQDLLWHDRPPALVQKQLTAYWARNGLQLRFVPFATIDRELPGRTIPSPQRK